MKIVSGIKNLLQKVFGAATDTTPPAPAESRTDQPAKPTNFERKLQIYFDAFRQERNHALLVYFYKSQDPSSNPFIFHPISDTKNPQEEIENLRANKNLVVIALDMLKDKDPLGTLRKNFPQGTLDVPELLSGKRLYTLLPWDEYERNRKKVIVIANPETDTFRFLKVPAHRDTSQSPEARRAQIRLATQDGRELAP